MSTNKTRASKARAIFATFSTEHGVANLTVDEAYGRRKRRETQWPPKKMRSGGGPATLHSFLGQVSDNASQLVQEVGEVDPGKAQQMLGEVERAIEQLEVLRTHLRRQVASTGIGPVGTVGDHDPRRPPPNGAPPRVCEDNSPASRRSGSGRQANFNRKGRKRR
jgi:hypothetical protein